MLTQILLLATTAAAAPDEGGIMIKSMYIGGTAVTAIITGLISFRQGKAQKVQTQDPVNVSGVKDKTFVTCEACKEHMRELALKCETDIKASATAANSAVTNLFGRMTDVEKGVSGVQASVDAVKETSAQILQAIIKKGIEG